MIEKNFNYDDILQEIGMFGRYQVMMYCLLLFPILFVAMFSAQYVFNAGPVEYRCKVPECEEEPLEWQPGDWGAWTLPDGKLRRCERYRPLIDYDMGRCVPTNFDTNSTVVCDEWVYKNHHTVVCEFDLACSEWKRTLIGTIHGAGVFFALPCVGYVSDTFGRRPALAFTAICGGLMGLVRSISNTYIMYLIFEFLDAFLGSGAYAAGYVLAVEMVDTNWRVYFGNIAACTFALGQVLISLISWGIQDWELLTRIVYGPAILFVFYCCILEESARWLLSKGHKAEAAKIIFRFAKKNKKKLSPALVKYLKFRSILKLRTSETLEKSYSKRVMQSRVIVCRLTICSFWWIVVTLIYYGISVNSITLAGNGNINFVLTALAEIPGYLLSALTLDRFGRKHTMMAAYFLCGAALVAMTLVVNSTAVLCMNLLGKLCISMVFGSLYVYTIELFPTDGRASLLAVCSTIGRFGAMCAPQTPLLLEITPSLPYLVFGILAVCAGALTILTPETLGMRLPDTIPEAEALAVSAEFQRTNAEALAGSAEYPQTNEDAFAIRATDKQTNVSSPEGRNVV